MDDPYLPTLGTHGMDGGLACRLGRRRVGLDGDQDEEGSEIDGQLRFTRHVKGRWLLCGRGTKVK